jgi:YYY domain-containing protein
VVQVFTWWLMVQLIGWTALPIAFRIFRWLPDHGYSFSKALGLLLSSYFLWIGASTGFLNNDSGGILASVLLVAVISAWFMIRPNQKAAPGSRQTLWGFLSANKKLVLVVEILFTVALAAWAVLRAYATYKIMPTGGEKFMEIAFLNGTLQSINLPPMDPWLSGFAISYYYFGYVMMAMLTRLSGALPGVGFDLYDALLFSLTVVGVFGVVYNLVAGWKKREQDAASDAGSQALRYGLLGSLLVVIMGNLEGFLEALHAKGLLSQGFWTWLNIPDLAQIPVNGTFYPGTTEGWWWWRASRVLFDDPINPHPTNSITEFPFFSFLLGDNHPHVLALPFVLLIIGLALNLIRKQFFENEAGEEPASPSDWWNPISGVFHNDFLLFIFYSLCVGSLGFLNTWDMPIYIGVIAVAYGAGSYVLRRKLDLELVLRAIALAASLLFASLLLYILFYLSFGSQAGGILPYVFPPTRLPQYLVMFGIYIFIVAWFLIASVKQRASQNPDKGSIRRILVAWGWVILATFGAYALLLAVFGISQAGRQLIQRVLNDPTIQASLGSLGIGEALRAVILYRLADPWLFLLLSALLAITIVGVKLLKDQGFSEPEDLKSPAAPPAVSDLFVSVLIFVGLALTFSVEFFYLRDSFGVRMNTVFKFYYQGWVMLGIASAYGLWWLLNPGRQVFSGVMRGTFLTGAVLLIVAGMVYPVMGYYSRAEGFSSQANINGASGIAQDNPDDWAAIEWLRANTNPEDGDVPTILEAPADSYKYEGRISAFSGDPALLGWAVHESQWRGNYDEQGKREPDIITIYTTKDIQQALDLLYKWQVKYVIVGDPERRYIQQKCDEAGRVCNLSSALHKFDAAFPIVFQHGELKIYEVPGGDTVSSNGNQTGELTAMPGRN